MANDSWLLRNGTLFDGVDTAARPGDVLLRGGRIEAIGAPGAVTEARTLDCTGLTIAPGFIDAHSHSDLQVLEGRREKLRQGVTTEVVGNCGFSAYPPSADPAELRNFANGIFCGDDTWGWPSTDAYLRAVEKSATAHVVSLVGHGALRIAVAGMRQGALPDALVDRMCGLLEEAFAAGAAGLSTGLMYAPGSSAPGEELEALCRVVARHGKVYTSHIRSYTGDLVAAIEEQIALARQAGCRLQISHLQAAGAANWPEQARAIEAIEQAHAGGVDIAFDCYPYLAGSTVLTQLLPQWVLDGGAAAMLARLGDAAERQRIRAEILQGFAWRWSDIYITAVATSNHPWVGCNLQQIGERRSVEPVDAMLALLEEERGAVNMLSFNQSEDNLRLSLTHPLGLVISDGFYVRGRPHPRLHGTFPLLLGTIARQRNWLTASEAIRKITSRPAERFHLRDRGVLRPGAWGDVTVFDAERVDSPATYDDPERAPVGIHAVFRRGELVEGGA